MSRTSIQASGDEVGSGSRPVPQPIGRRRRWAIFCRNRPALIGAAFLVLLALVAIFAPILAPRDPNEQDLYLRYAGISRDAWLGTDSFGRDHFSRLIYGARVSLVAALTALVIATLIGVSAGLLAGYVGGIVDRALSWFMNVLMSVPALVLAITIVAVLGRGLINAMIAVGIAFVPRFFRVTRAQSKVLAAEIFIEASRAIGCRRRRILGAHLFPNVLSPVLVQVSLALGAAVTAEASLSFIGLGVAPPAASWGSMLQQGAGVMQTSPLLVIAPGVMISLTVLAFSLAGDGLRDALGTGRQSQIDTAPVT